MRAPLLALVAALVAGCAVAPSPSGPARSPVPQPSPAGPTPPTITTATPSEPTPAMTLPPLDPSIVGLTCGDNLFFHPALLAQPGRAEADPDAAAAALRAELATAPDDSGLPQTGWVRVAQLADRALFVARGGFESGWAAVGVGLRDGRWQTDQVGQCRLQPVVPDGVSVAELRLDPAFPEPGADATTLHLLITEQACANGQPPNGRVLPPTVITTAEAVTVTVLVRHVPGGADCPGNPEFPIEFELPEPLGQRRVLDGGVFPPRQLVSATGVVRSYELQCGPMEIRACTRYADEAVANAALVDRARKVVRFVIDSPDGSYTMTFDDGTAESVILN